jgi:dTDP-4-dehydrorhamnose reductase
MTSPRIAVTGGDGVLGRALREFLPDARFLSRAECDVRDYFDVDRACRGADVVIHAAALTDHQHPNAGEIIETNIFGTQNVARWCSVSDAHLLYLSTHYVYEGTRGNYTEHDVVRPIGAYAWSKLAGEDWVAELCPASLVVRGSWYTYRTRVAHWRRNGALTDAFCSREPVESAAA